MVETQQVWVFGGGGVSGIAWETGILAGLVLEGVTIASDATLLGTSAGSTVAAQLASGMPIAELYERQARGVPWEISKGLGLGSLLRYASAALFTRTPEATARRIGSMALKAKVAPYAVRRQVIEQRLPSDQWSDADVRLVVVDAVSGVTRILTRADGLELVDAVAASCAVPLASPPVELDGHRYMDGGMRSTLNLDLAPGTGPVIGISPSSASLTGWGRIDAQRARMAPDRVVEVLTMDDEGKKAQGRDPFDKDVVPAVVAAGREQGRREALGLRLPARQWVQQPLPTCRRSRPEHYSLILPALQMVIRTLSDSLR